MGGLLEGEPRVGGPDRDPCADARGFLVEARKSRPRAPAARSRVRRAAGVRRVRRERTLDLRGRDVRDPESRGHAQQPGVAGRKVLARVRSPRTGQSRLGQGDLRRGARRGTAQSCSPFTRTRFDKTLRHEGGPFESIVGAIAARRTLSTARFSSYMVITTNSRSIVRSHSSTSTVPAPRIRTSRVCRSTAGRT